MRTITRLLVLFLCALGTLFPPLLEAKERPQLFLGANLWYGMNLGSEGGGGGGGGDRARLMRELDRLQGLGVTNLRVLAAGEGPDSEPWRIAPALQPSPGVYRQDVLGGLEFLLREMEKRGMQAVVYLNNFWPWSGGMAQYLSWAGAGPIPYPPPQPGGDWIAYQRYASKFYSDETAASLARAALARIVTRFARDPAILAWQLANEPRGRNNAAALGRWIEATAGFIKELDPAHLVTTGSEGDTPWHELDGLDFVANHSYKNIDYATAHIWAESWNWYDPKRAAETFDTAVTRMKAYLWDHIEKAKRLGKPLVIEEFGLARDDRSFDPASPTTYRDRYYAAVFGEILRAVKAGAPVAGVNFWAWAGEGRPRKPYGGFWKAGDPFTGDPPHEPQGWNGVYESDASTLKVISKFAREIGKLHRDLGAR